jgi:hypothetical protein
MNPERGSEWYIRRDAEQPEKGPFSAEAVASSLKDGSIQPSTQVREHGSQDWAAVGEHPAFKPSPPSAEAVRSATLLGGTAADSEAAPADERAAGRAQCSRCKSHAMTGYKRTFLGFYRVSCEQCSHTELLPLSAAYRWSYGLAAAYACVWAVQVAAGKPHVPGGIWVFFGAAGALALTEDAKLRRRLGNR